MNPRERRQRRRDALTALGYLVVFVFLLLSTGLLAAAVWTIGAPLMHFIGWRDAILLYGLREDDTP